MHAANVYTMTQLQLCVTEEQIYQDVKRDQSKLRILKDHTADLIQYMYVPSLLPYLHKQSLITLSEFGKLDKEQDPEKKNRLLLRILPTKGKLALEKFLHCLKSEKQHLGHVDLAQDLEASLNHLMPSSDV